VDTSKRADWLIPTGLIALAAIPVAAGIVRLVTLSSGAAVTPDNSHFFASPVPVILHIVGATIYCVLGAFQFTAGFRRRHPTWHRVAGRLLLVCGLTAALSGLWMTMFYAIVPADNALLHAFRLLAGSGMLVSIVLGLLAIRRRDVRRHQAWLRRAYAIGQGAGTQALILGPALLIFGPPNDLCRALMMGAGWAVNLAVAEAVARI
jgi:hypothetical protein